MAGVAIVRRRLKNHRGRLPALPAIRAPGKKGLAAEIEGITDLDPVPDRVNQIRVMGIGGYGLPSPRRLVPPRLAPCPLRNLRKP